MRISLSHWHLAVWNLKAVWSCHEMIYEAFGPWATDIRYPEIKDASSWCSTLRKPTLVFWHGHNEWSPCFHRTQLHCDSAVPHSKRFPGSSNGGLFEQDGDHLPATSWPSHDVGSLFAPSSMQFPKFDHWNVQGGDNLELLRCSSPQRKPGTGCLTLCWASCRSACVHLLHSPEHHLAAFGKTANHWFFSTNSTVADHCIRNLKELHAACIFAGDANTDPKLRTSITDMCNLVLRLRLKSTKTNKHVTLGFQGTKVGPFIRCHG